jgi:hypothetical protein
MKRRSFLKKTTVGLSTLAGWAFAESGTGKALPRWEAAPGQATPPADSYHVPEWVRYMRAIYFEGYAPPMSPHVKDFDAKRIVAAAQELGGDTLRFQSIGHPLAVFPSKVFPSYPELNGRDLINEVSRECRRVGMHLYVYSQLNRACSTGNEYRQAIRKYVAELCAHDVDGIYFDAPSAYRGTCYCDDCQVSFKAFSGMDVRRLPSTLHQHHLEPDGIPDDADMEAISAWYDWANKLQEEDLVDLRKIIHGSGKFMLCHNGATWWFGSFHPQYKYSDGFMVEYSDEFYQRLLRAMMGSSMARPRKQMAQAYMGSYDVAAIGHPPHNHPWSQHAINMEDGDEIRMEGFADLAGGNIPLYGVMNRLLYGIGDGSTEPAKEVFSVMRRAEPILKDSAPVSYMTIVPTFDSMELFRTRHHSWNMAMSEGMALTMLDAHIAFDVAPNLEMTDEWLKGQRVIALCGASAITDDDARRLTDWVKAGGGLLATYDSGLFGEKGKLRQDGGALRELLGVEMQGEAPDAQTNTYYRIKQAHPALGKYKLGQVVMGDASLVRVKVLPGAEVLAECIDVESQEIYGPAIVLNRYGKGQAIYVGGSLEANYVASRVTSLRRLLTSMVRYLGGDAPMPFHLEAPRGVYGILRRVPGGDLGLWLCANVGFKDAAVGRMRQEFLPVSNVEARIRVPEGKQVKSVHLARSDRSAPFTVSGGYVVVKIPTLHIAELVHVALG